MSKQWKATTVDWEALEDYDDVAINKVCLTQKQIAILKAVLSPQYWSTRWTNQTDDWDTINAYVASLDAKLDGQECEVMTFCDDVANCIDTSDGVSTSLVEWNTIHNGTGGVGNPEAVLPESVREADLLPEDFTCDNDHRYGTAVGIVNAIHKATTEVFEAIEVLTDPLELVAEVADNVPLAEAAGVALEYMLWIQETAYDLYVAAWSDTVKDAISCEIFCLLQDEWPCHLDYEMLMSVYQDPAFLNPPDLTASWSVWANWLMELPFTTNELIVKLCGLMGLLVMRYGAKYSLFYLGIRSLQTTIALLVDDTNPDWATLCLECPPRWSHYWNFVTHGQEAWIVDSDYGTFTVGVGFETEEKPLTGDWKLNIIEYLALYEAIPRCDRFTIHHTIVRGTIDTSPFPFVVLQRPPITPDRTWSSGYIQTGSGTFLSVFNLTNLSYVRVGGAISDYTESAITGSFIITGVTLEGEGSDPFAGRVTS